MFTDSNEIFEKISEAVQNYIPCQGKCSCNIKSLKLDLKPYKGGINKSMISKAQDRGTKYQIIDGRLYRQRECMFPARCSGIEYFIKRLLSSLPNMEIIINTRDWPQISSSWGTDIGPVFSFSKTSQYLDIMYPTWSFWEGGPAISLYPTGIGRWDLHRKSINETSALKYSWDKKKNVGFFRGSRTSHERDSLILLSRAKPDLIDAQYTKNQAWKSPEDTLNVNPAPEMSFENHCEYKYLFNFRGVAASFRLKHLFLCRSLIFHVGDDWKEFFYGSMIPWVHYVPINSNPTAEEIEKLLIFFKENDKIAKEIADRGFNYIWNQLRMKDIFCYWKKLLLRYSKLLQYDIVLDLNLIEIK